ncbi:hypothetical protein ACIQD1_34295 [Streptomyces sp. NPDC093088]|uniref:hypothetical protein n=1 Tax=Streptomyces sp. NPDC093088 TaxID=3366023 RepID=UPI00382D0E39
MRALRVPCVAVSASRHARTLLASTGLDRFLADVVDGGDAARLALPGKPDPALFLHAAASWAPVPATPPWSRTRSPGCGRPAGAGEERWFRL